MAKEKKKKQYKDHVNSKHFTYSVMRNEDGSVGGNPVEVRNVLTRKEKKNGVIKDTESVIATVLVSGNDVFEICECTFSFETKLNVEEYTEIFKAVFEQAAEGEKVSYIRVHATGLDPDIEEAMWRNNCKGDPIDREYLLWEAPQGRYMALYMCLGCCFGLCFGEAVFDNMSIGLSVGIGMGLLLGSMLDLQKKNVRDALFKKRIEDVSKNRSEKESEEE